MGDVDDKTSALIAKLLSEDNAYAEYSEQEYAVDVSDDSDYGGHRRRKKAKKGSNLCKLSETTAWDTSSKLWIPKTKLFVWDKYMAARIDSALSGMLILSMPFLMQGLAKPINARDQAGKDSTRSLVQL